MNKKEKLESLKPWFKGLIYDKGTEVINLSTQEKVYLDNIALSIYDFIKGSEVVLMLIEKNNIEHADKKEIIESMQKGLSWFSRYYPKEYMILLD